MRRTPSIQVGLADRRKAPSLATLTNQPTPPVDGATPNPSRILRILSENKTHYRVQWSQPEANPEVGPVTIQWMNRQAAYKEVVEKWWHEQEQQQQQQDEAGSVVEEDEGEDSSMSSAESAESDAE